MRTKKEIRQEIFKIRKSITEQEHADYSFGIFNQLKMLPEYKSAMNVYAYCHIGNEAGTELIIKDILHSGKHIALPRIESGIMNFYEITSLDQLKEGYFHIPEPVNNTKPNAPDIVIVPGVAFSYDFDRLGYGGGFYDRFLKDGMTKIALAFDFQLLDNLPVEECDKKVDIIVTQTKILRRG